jgi:hypothetical protein
MEIGQQERQTASVIALDRVGRKFTNCTSVIPILSVKGEGNVKIVQQISEYNAIR